MWSTVLPPEPKDTYTAILGISRANHLDEGTYTCKVSKPWSIDTGEHNLRGDLLLDR